MFSKSLGTACDGVLFICQPYFMHGVGLGQVMNRPEPQFAPEKGRCNPLMTEVVRPAVRLFKISCLHSTNLEYSKISSNFIFGL